MTISQIISLSKPSDSSLVPKGTFGYFRSRNKHRLYSLVIAEFKRSGLSQADLARRLGKRPDVVCRWLAGPTNWTIDTVSDLLFAISGAEPEYGVNYPLDQPMRNDTRPRWLENYRLGADSLPKSNTGTQVGGRLRVVEITS